MTSFMSFFIEIFDLLSAAFVSYKLPRGPGVEGATSNVLVRCLLPTPLAGLTSVAVLSFDTPPPRVGFSAVVGKVATNEPPLSFPPLSYHRDKDVKLTINSIFLSVVSRALSTNKYNGDFSS